MSDPDPLVEWSPAEQAVADLLRDEVGLPRMAHIRDVWDDDRPREENIAALQAADREADAANLAFVRKVIGAAQSEVERLRALLAPTVDMTSPHRVDPGNEETPADPRRERRAP